MFDPSWYDFYVGESRILFAGDIDEDAFEIYYLPCLVQLNDQDEYIDSAFCQVKRHQVRIFGLVDIPAESQLTITLVDIRNPEADTPLKFLVAIMDRGDIYFSNFWDRVVYSMTY